MCLSYLYLTPEKMQLLQYTLTRNLMLFYHFNNSKHKPMVAISGQYSFGADKAVRISQAVFFNKGTQPEIRHKNCKITLLIWISDLHYEWLFWIKTFGKFVHCFIFYAHATDLFCLEGLTFKMVIKVSA